MPNIQRGHIQIVYRLFWHCRCSELKNVHVLVLSKDIFLLFPALNIYCWMEILIGLLKCEAFAIQESEIHRIQISETIYIYNGYWLRYHNDWHRVTIFSLNLIRCRSWTCKTIYGYKECRHQIKIDLWYLNIGQKYWWRSNSLMLNYQSNSNE